MAREFVIAVIVAVAAARRGLEMSQFHPRRPEDALSVPRRDPPVCDGEPRTPDPLTRVCFLDVFNDNRQSR